MMVHVLCVCLNCQHQEEVGINLTDELENKIGYLVLKHCDYCITNEDLTEYSGNTQLKIQKRRKALSLLNETKEESKIATFKTRRGFVSFKVRKKEEK